MALNLQKNPLTREHIEKAILSACERRQSWINDGDKTIAAHAHRLVDTMGDGLPGLVVDRYGEDIRIEYYSEVYPQWDELIRACFQKAIPDIQGIVSIVRKGQGQVEVIFDSVQLAEKNIVERERIYAVRLNNADAAGTGVFFDQRLTRDRVQAYSRNASVLNLFAHAGAFGVAAAVGGAQQIDHVDAARKSARWAAHNYELNGINPKDHRFIVDDVFKFLRRMQNQGRRYDIILCDPPVFSKGASKARGERMKAKEILPYLADVCMELLASEGFLCFSCNDRRLRQSDLLSLFEDDGRVAVRQSMPIGRDFTAAEIPDVVSTKGVWINKK